jgi:ABC-type uncharacterized transport system involved in gliding motility auxiliary subunit
MAMSIRKSQLSTIAYWIALISLIFAGGWYVINRNVDIVIQISLILTAISIVVAVAVDPKRVRDALVGRQAKYGSNALVFSLAFIGILSVLNFLLYKNPVQWDLTEDKLFTLSPETLKVLADLSAEVQIKGFYTPDYSSARENVRPLLDQYAANSDHKLTYEFIDPEEFPYIAQQYNVIRDGSLVITSGDQSEVVETASEQDITEALVRVLNPEARKVYFLIGHGERDIDATDESGYYQVNRSLLSKGYQVENLNLLSEGSIPDDATVLLIAAPTANLLDSEIELVSEYLQEGGAAIFLFEPMMQTVEEYENDPLIAYLKEKWGIEVVRDLVVDTSTDLPFYGISYDYASHPITDELGNLVTYFPTARSLKSLDLQESLIEEVNLVQTGENSWGETDFAAVENQESIEFTEGVDAEGPLTLAISADDTQSGARLVVFGDSDFASNTFFFELGNGDLLLNSVDWVAGEEQLIRLTPKQTTSRYVLPPTVQVTGAVFLITIVLIPGIVMVVGASTWWQRRKRE